GSLVTKNTRFLSSPRVSTTMAPGLASIVVPLGRSHSTIRVGTVVGGVCAATEPAPHIALMSGTTITGRLPNTPASLRFLRSACKKLICAHVAVVRSLVLVVTAVSILVAAGGSPTG